MKTQEYNKIRKRLGWSAAKAGRILGPEARQSYRIAAGHSPVPKSVAKLITLVDHISTEYQGKMPSFTDFLFEDEKKNV